MTAPLPVPLDNKAVARTLTDIADLLDKAGTHHAVNEQENEKIVDAIHQALSPNRG